MFSTTLFTIFLCCVVSYFVGSLPFGLWVGLLWKRVDIRTLGSQNIGTTNVLRVLGPGPGIVVCLLDTLKGGVGVWLAHALKPNLPIWVLIPIGFLAIAGHTFSIFLRFRGGKGVATSLGALLALSSPVAGIALAVWILLVAATRYVSVASLFAGLSLPFAAYFTVPEPGKWWMVGLGTALFLLVLVKHRSNIQRLRAGTEPKFGQRVPLPASPQGGEEPECANTEVQ